MIPPCGAGVPPACFLAGETPAPQRRRGFPPRRGRTRMKTNPVKQKLRRGEPTFGTWLSLGSLHSARVLARSGFDWLTLDIEHSAIDWSHGGDDLRRGGRRRLRAPVPRARGGPLLHQTGARRRGVGHRRADGRHGRAGPGGHRRGQVSARGQPQRRRRHARAELRRRAGRILSSGPTTRSSSSSRPRAPRAWRTPRPSTACPAATPSSSGPVDLRFNMRTPDGDVAHARGARGDGPAGDRRSARRWARRRASTSSTWSTPWRGPSRACSSSPSAATCWMMNRDLRDVIDVRSPPAQEARKVAKY